MELSVRETACVCALLISIKKQKRKKRYWIHPSISQRLLKGEFYKLYEDLRTSPQKFFDYYKMSMSSFDELLRIVGPSITLQDTNLRRSVPPEERLSVTLRYLATGCSMVSLHHEYLLGMTTIREIIRDVCDKIWMCLMPLCIPVMDEDAWLNTADAFYRKTQFPNCVGAIEGKHVKICKPNTSGSVVLMAVVDANYCLLSVDIATIGNCSDSAVFKNTNFCHRLERDQLKLPGKGKLPGDDNGQAMPFVLVGNEAFTLSEHVLRPYARKSISQSKKIFNYRLSRARKMAESAFGILANKWKIFQRPIDVKPEFCDCIIKACCILHNYVLQRDGVSFEDTLYECPLKSLDPCNVRAPSAAISARDYFAEHFTSSHGSVPWQYSKI